MTNTHLTSSALAGRYLQVLQDFNPELLDRHAPRVDAKRLSGLFIPSVPPNLHLARHRIMIVGCETRQWNVLRDGERFSTLDHYVEQAMQAHRGYFEKQLIKADIKGRAFHNFTRAVAKRCGGDGLIYANLLCMAWDDGSPVHSPHIKLIKHYSRLLLEQQIDFFQPDIVIFANGSATAGIRRDFFPLARDAAGKAVGQDYTSDGIANAQLWQFTLSDRLRCFRIQHPSSRSPASAQVRKFLMTLLPSQSLVFA